MPSNDPHIARLLEATATAEDAAHDAAPSAPTARNPRKPSPSTSKAPTSAAAAAAAAPKPAASPAWRHADQLLSRLHAALRASPDHPVDSQLASDGTVTNDNNVSWMARYVATTRARLRARVPAHVPVEERAVEAAWEDVERRCYFIDRGINDNVGELDAITGQYPGEVVFGEEEKELARFLVQGLEDFRVE